MTSRRVTLDDVPHWAVTSAMRRWNRGNCGYGETGRPYDIHWCPAPAELRRVALAETYKVSARAGILDSLLAAEVLVEYSGVPDTFRVCPPTESVRLVTIPPATAPPSSSPERQ